MPPFRRTARMLPLQSGSRAACILRGGGKVLSFIIMLVAAALIGWVADLVVPGDLPFGWVGAIIGGLVGAWIGTVLLGDWGPSLGDLALIPVIIGAIVLAFVVRFLLGSASR